jgi:hypothetical protein
MDMGLVFWVGGIQFAWLPTVAEELATEHINALAVVGGSVLFEGVVEGLDGATPGARERWRRGRFLK